MDDTLKPEKYVPFGQTKTSINIGVQIARKNLLTMKVMFLVLLNSSQRALYIIMQILSNKYDAFLCVFITFQFDLNSKS